MRYLRYLLLASVFLLTACEQVARLDYDTDFEFKDSWNYAWVPDKALGKHPEINELTMRRVHTSVDNKLGEMGWKAVDEADAEILVHAFITVETKIESTGTHAYYGMYYNHPHPHNWAGFGAVNVYTYEEGMMVLDLVDAKTKKLVWRGSFQSRLRTRQTPEEREKTINETVRKILDSYPHGYPAPVK